MEEFRRKFKGYQNSENVLEANLINIHCTDWEIEALEVSMICCRFHSKPEAEFYLECMFWLPIPISQENEGKLTCSSTDYF